MLCNASALSLCFSHTEKAMACLMILTVYYISRRTGLMPPLETILATSASMEEHLRLMKGRVHFELLCLNFFKHHIFEGTTKSIHFQNQKYNYTKI